MDNKKIVAFSVGRPKIYLLENMRLGEEKEYKIPDGCVPRLMRERLRSSARNAKVIISTSVLQKPGYITVRRIG